ncbi:oxidoreductase [Lentzea tibetensis]|uniref:Oxidoreductase n=1 Tax=Lentzea tibetensis TaxID=2591470 RepID=A0A563EJ42_9PSEU|nr:oxidoreductase [Lentzea tibetensis]TWP46848.1 oxidoreductase [Lentzea tibetensis]
MRIIAALCALSLLVVPGVAQADASYWDLKPTGTDARLRGLSAVNAQVAWVSGSKGTVLRTTDGGRSWKSVGPPDTATLEFRDIQAFDARTAVALSIGEGEASRIYRTDDGGRTWRESFRNTDPKAFYDCVAFFDHHRGLALSDPVDGKFRVLSTRDGGRSWQVNDPKGMPQALEGEFAFAASGQCVTTAGHHAWIATGGGAKARVLHSKDTGRTWEAAETPLPSGPAAGVFAVAFRTPWQGVAIGGDYLKPDDPTPALALSRDGRTWQPTKQAPVGYRSGVAFRGSGLVAVGPTGTDVSRDGQKWTKADAGSFDTVDCPGWTCWAAGEKGRVGRLR